MNKTYNKNTDITIDRHIDITSDTCPMTFVKTKLQIEKMEVGDIIEVLLNDGEPLKNVPLSAQELGHTILSTTAQTDGRTYKLLIQKN